MQLKARRARAATAGCSTARRSGPPRRTSPSGTGSARAPIRDKQARRHHAVPDPDGPPGPHHQRHADDRRRAHQRGVLRRRVRARRLRRRRAQRGFQYISEALDLERFTMFTFSPIEQRLELLGDYVRTAERDGEPLRDDPSCASASRSCHRARGGARAGPARSSPRSSRGAAASAADGRGLGVQALRDRALAARRQRGAATSAARQRSCGCTPPRPRMTRPLRDRPTATR